MRIPYVIVLVILCSLGTWKWASAQAAAQAIGITPVPPRVMTGSDLGFQVEGLRGETAVGRLVVRVNGRWVDAEVTPLQPRQLSQR